VKDVVESRKYTISCLDELEDGVLVAENALVLLNGKSPENQIEWETNMLSAPSRLTRDQETQ
jgi:hypothetical protein